jgi:sugar-specific transcriptional regulator TrmB
MMITKDLALLEDVGLTVYERKALATLLSFGVADAPTLCREAGIPSSKIYRAMEKLAQLRLVELRSTRPRLFAAIPTDAVVERLVQLARERAERFTAAAASLRETFATLAGQRGGRQPLVDLALGAENHVRRHLVYLASARQQILSYMERNDLLAIGQAVEAGFPVLRRIARNSIKNQVEHRVIFGFSYRSAPQLQAFLKRYRLELRRVTGVRYSGELGHPFHVIDEETVIVPLDHPFVREGRYASLLVRDKDLAQSITGGFHELWRKAMHDLREINFDPRGASRGRAE